MDMGPSQGFMSKLGSNIKRNAPTALNALGQQMGGSMSGAAKVTGGLMGDRMARQRMGNQPGVNPSAGMPNSPFGRVNFGGAPMQNGQPPMGGPPPSMGMPPPQPMAGMGSPSNGFMNPNMGSQLWSNYNNAALPPGGQQAPGLNKQIFY